jgi:glucose dehydrogenase
VGSLPGNDTRTKLERVLDRLFSKCPNERRGFMRQATLAAGRAIAALGVLAGSIVGMAALAAAEVTPDDGQWIRPAKDLASTRYSGLDQINAGNVARM